MLKIKNDIFILLISIVSFVLITPQIVSASSEEDNVFLTDTMPNSVQERLDHSYSIWNGLITDLNLYTDGELEQNNLEKNIESFIDKLNAINEQSKDGILPDKLDRSNKRFTKAIYKTEQSIYKLLAKEAKLIQKDLNKGRFNGEKKLEKNLKKYEKRLSKSDRQFAKINKIIKKMNKKNDFELKSYEMISYSTLLVTIEEDVANTDADIKENEKKSALSFDGSLNMIVSNDNVDITINSNVPDGGIFEVFVMNSDLDLLSEFLEIKDGEIHHTFDVSDWPVGYISGSAHLRFNIADHPQPDSIVELYGENGQLMTGNKAEDNNVDGLNGIIETEIIAYPSEQAVSDQNYSDFNDAITEMINLSEGVILDIRTLEDDDWSTAIIVISDDWYYTPEHEKQRFVDVAGDTLTQLIKNHEIEETTYVRFKDSYGAELASQKIFGGYDIKN
ncbi:hypothetical protein [Shouchella lehensis]|uniref:Uncharacterized protein n=1 Tax=Shouchella lehensis G1 TaxID=1246626 RepID=A0A060M0J4_9BACI|nr:hypothetical protein [Shouchella lehensis]AIC95967.1 hypothetical protein BleG1_3420 [Shouchella lehensis G1]